MTETNHWEAAPIQHRKDAVCAAGLCTFCNPDCCVGVHGLHAESCSAGGLRRAPSNIDNEGTL